MTRDGLPRAYLRIDPNIDQVYPELRNTFVGLMCSGHRQPERGRYRDRQLVEGLHSRPFVRRCFDRGDLVTLPDGRVYIDGWDEWQEGDLTVSERMRRMRQRRRSKRNGVTDEPSPDRLGVTTDAVVVVNGSLSGVSDSDTPKPPPSGGRRSEGTNPRAIAAELTRRAEEAERERKRRRNVRHLAYLGGRLTEAQRIDMDDRDAPLEEIPPDAPRDGESESDFRRRVGLPAFMGAIS